MSVEGLLSEVNALLGARLAITAGDQAFFGGKRIFSDAQAASSTSSQSAQKGEGKGKKGGKKDELLDAIQNAKQIAGKALAGQSSSSSGADPAALDALRKDHADLAKQVAKLTALVESLQVQLSTVKGGEAAPAAVAEEAKEEPAGGDDDFDLFGSDDEEEDEEKKKIVEERLAAYAAKKSTKPGPIAKSSVILDVKPWDDETNLEEMEKLVRGIEMDGLVWGGGKQIPIGYGIKKFQIICVIEDLKVSVDDLIEKITGDFEDHVQSVDIVAFNKI